MDRRQDRGPEYTVTFLNKQNIDVDQARSMFEEFGRLLRVSESNGRFFIKYQNKDHSDAAIARYGRELNLDYARERSDRDKDRDRQAQDRDVDRNRQNREQDRDGERGRLPQERDRDVDRGRGRDFRSGRNFGDDRSSDVAPNTASRPFNTPQSEPPHSEQGQPRNQSHPLPPVLIDSGAKLPDKFLFILGNLPHHFTQDDVKNLIQEVKPLHIGNIATTSKWSLRFCPIHLDTTEKVEYLENKLDGFILGNHQLIAMEADQLFMEANNVY